MCRFVLYHSPSYKTFKQLLQTVETRASYTIEDAQAMFHMQLSNSLRRGDLDIFLTFCKSLVEERKTFELDLNRVFDDVCIPCIFFLTLLRLCDLF